ncbi:hypothetical protein TNCV_4752451 [Trichonephila clavipes]|nr:hypothetical protein TNCV_4752451 [Trichonephila clavipes]
MPQIKNTYQQVKNSIEAGSLPIASGDYGSVIMPVALVEIQSLLCEYEINGLLRVMLTAYRISTRSSDLRPRGQTYCEVGPEKPYNHITDH